MASFTLVTLDLAGAVFFAGRGTRYTYIHSKQIARPYSHYEASSRAECDFQIGQQAETGFGLVVGSGVLLTPSGC